MADQKISDLTTGTTPADTDLFPIARPGSPNATLSLLWSSIKAAVKAYTDTLYPSGSGTSSGTNTGDQTTVSGNAGTATALQTARAIDGQSFDGTAAITVIAPGTHAATGKTTPVDADELALVDSAASNVLKKLTWANLKATIKAYTDTLYPSGSGTSTGTNTGDQTISDATISTTDITTNNVSTSKHGFAPKAPNDATKYLDGTGAYSVPPSGGSTTRTILLMPAAAVLPDGSSGNLAPQRLRFQGTESNPKKHFLALAFDGGGNKEIGWWTFRMPVDYASGGAVVIDWMLNGTANAVVWSAQLGAVTPADADTPIEHASAAASSATTSVNATEARRLTQTSITLSNLDSVAGGDLVSVAIFRDSSDASDTATQDAELVAAAFTYTSA